MLREHYEIIKIDGKERRVRLFTLGQQPSKYKVGASKRKSFKAEMRAKKYKEQMEKNPPKPRCVHNPPKYTNPFGKSFYGTLEWRILRLETFRRYGYICMACGRKKIHGAQLHVDHIKPRSKFPELQLDPENLQVLCDVCNIEKGDRIADFRKPIPYRRGIK